MCVCDDQWTFVGLSLRASVRFLVGSCRETVHFRADSFFRHLPMLLRDASYARCIRDISPPRNLWLSPIRFR